MTSNHIDLLVNDAAPKLTAQSMKLIAGRTAQEYDQYRNRTAPSEKDLYGASAFEAGEHLHRYLGPLAAALYYYMISSR